VLNENAKMGHRAEIHRCQNVGILKKIDMQGIRPPLRHCEIEEDLLMQAEKTPEPLSHPYTRAI
jgi:hypothetical protein